VVALTTQSDVSLVAADEYLLVVRSIPTVCEGGRSPVRTATTEGRETLHVVCERNAVEKLSKGPAIRVAIESHEIEMLSMRIDDPFDKRHEALEKLGFVNNQNGKARPILQPKVVEVAYSDTRGPLSVVRRNLVAAVSRIVCMLDDKNRSVEGRIPRNETQNPTGLARKHRTHEDGQGHLRRTCVV
jgi:hypothetical protein